MSIVSRRRKPVVSLVTIMAHLWWISPALSNPTGPNVVAGQATVSGVGTPSVTIQQASRAAIINWAGFNIAPNEVTRFIQPDVRAIALNRIFDQHPSQIFGRLEANGSVILLNRNGILFGPNAQVNVGGLIASTLNLSNANFLKGYYLFEGQSTDGWVKNAGAIHAGVDGVYLLAPNVENSGLITSPQGQITLAAGSSVFLSNRPDGRGFLAELTAPTGQALNLKDLVADGGEVTLAGRVVNQEGLIQANSIRERNGRIELYASEQVTLTAGSRTEAKGGDQGVSNGGTIRAIADKANGQAQFEKGAVIDVSGGREGGRGGFVELSGKQVGLGGRFVGNAREGYPGGQLLIDPVDVDLSGLSVSGMSNIMFSSVLGDDLRVTGAFDLNTVEPPAGGGSIRFDAGRDLLFTDAFLLNGFGTPKKWDILGLAERDIQLTRTTLSTDYGGSINLTARTGSVQLIDPPTGALSSLVVQGGGGISINAAKNLVASVSVDPNTNSVQGIQLDGPGSLNITLGGDFLGGRVDGLPAGPGFMVRNGQATVNVAGNIGETNLPLGPDGLPDAAKISQQKLQENTIGYADLASANSSVTLTAGGNIYFRRIRDAGLVCDRSGAFCGTDADGSPRIPQLSPGLENNQVFLTSTQGHIFLNTSPTSAGEQATDLPVLSSILPASFDAQAVNGTIQIRSNLTFFPSPTGRLNFFAKQDIQGVPKTIKVPDEVNFKWVFFGFTPAGLPIWKAVDLRTALTDPAVQPFIGRPLPPGAGDPPPNESFPDYARVEQALSVPSVKLLEVSPSSLVGNTQLFQVTSLIRNNSPLAQNAPQISPVSFKTGTGDISRLDLNLISRPFKKEITIQSGKDINEVFLSAYLPDLGADRVTVTEHVPMVTDATTGLLRAPNPGEVVKVEDVTIKDVTVEVQVPKVAATIQAERDIDLSKPAQGSLGGLHFIGPGTAKITAKRDLNLGDGSGIDHQIVKEPSGLTDQGGFLDIAVGRDLLMTQSRIFSRNGAGISIHGPDEGTSYIRGYDNSALHPVEAPDSVRGALNVAPPVGGKVDVGDNKGKTVFDSGAEPTGIEAILGGSVGVKAEKPSVAADGTVAVNLVKDPAAISIRATGDVNVNRSRIATFRGGDIQITSTRGNINAGSGGRDEFALFPVDTIKIDPVTGNPVINPATGLPDLERTVLQVPGSGIFTFYPPPKIVNGVVVVPGDPFPLIFPKFENAALTAVTNEIIKQGFFGRNTSLLRAKEQELRAAYEPVFNAQLDAFINPLNLGNITLTAEQGNIIIPPAGIRGRDVALIAPNGAVVFQGGAVEGRARAVAQRLEGPILNVGVFAASTTAGTVSVSTGSSGGGSLAPLTSPGVAAPVSATVGASTAAAKSAESTEETAAETSSQQAKAEASARQTAARTDDKEKKTGVAQGVRVKRGVTIEVDVKPQVR